MKNQYAFSSADELSVLNNLNTAIFRTYPESDGKIIDVNPAFLAVFGYMDKSEVLSLKAEQLYADPNDRSIMRDEIESKGFLRDMEILLKRQDGESFFGRVSSVLVRDSEGDPLYIDGVVDDITLQRQQRIALGESESKNRAMADAASEAIIFFVDGLCIETNRSACKMFGYSVDEFLNQGFKSLFIGDEPLKTLSQNKIESEEAIRVSAIRKNESTFPAACRIRSFNHQDQEVVVCTIADLSTQEKALSELRDRQQQLLEERKVFFKGPVILIQWPMDENAPLLFISDNVKEILGYDVSDFLEDKLLYPDIVHPDDLNELQEHIRIQLGEGSDVVFEKPYRVRKKNGKYLWVQDYGYVQRDSSGRQTGIMGYIYDVTETQESLSNLTESELRYRGLVENSPTGILRMDLDGNIQDVNPRMVEILGSPSEEATKSFNIFKFKPLQDAGVSEKFKEAIEQQRIVNFNSTYVSAWDKTIHFQLVINPIYNVDGLVTGAQANMEDISGIYVAEEAEREAKKLQLEERNIFLAGPIMVLKWAKTATEPLIQVSENVEQILGYNAKELCNGDVLFVDIIHPDDSDRVRDTARKAISSSAEAFDTSAYRIRRKDGKYIWVNDHSTVIRDENGDVKNISGIVYDISHMKEAEEALEITQQNFQELFNAISEAVFIHDPDTLEILDVNETMLQMYGYEREEVLGSTVQKYSKLDSVMPSVLKLSNEAKAKGQTTYEWEAKRKNGEVFWAEVTLRMASIGGKEKMLANVRDISTRKQTLSELETSLNEQELLLREVHHRTKNNMQVINSLLNLQAEYTQDEKLFEIFGETQNRIKTMALIHEKLFRSKSMAAVDFGSYLNSLVHELINFYSVDGSRVKINQDVASLKLDITNAIPCGLIVNELVTNALKYAFPNNREGEIWLSVKGTDGGDAEVEVRDNGVGLDTSIDFETTQTMGLRIVRILTEQLGGKMTIQGKAGANFNLRFPLIDEA